MLVNSHEQVQKISASNLCFGTSTVDNIMQVILPSTSPTVSTSVAYPADITALYSTVQKAVMESVTTRQVLTNDQRLERHDAQQAPQSSTFSLLDLVWWKRPNQVALRAKITEVTSAENNVYKISMEQSEDIPTGPVETLVSGTQLLTRQIQDLDRPLIHRTDVYQSFEDFQTDDVVVCQAGPLMDDNVFLAKIVQTSPCVLVSRLSDDHVMDVTNDVLLIPPFRLTPTGRVPKYIQELCRHRGYAL
jgi:hypothetical protein